MPWFDAIAVAVAFIAMAALVMVLISRQFGRASAPIRSRTIARSARTDFRSAAAAGRRKREDAQPPDRAKP